MRNALTLSLGIILLVATAWFSEPGGKHAEEQRLGQEFHQVVTAQGPVAPPKGDGRSTAK